MNPSDATPYRFRPFEPAIFVELYLPKRARYQGTLYETLTDGFDFRTVREHFSNPERQRRIQLLLTEYTESRDLSIMQSIDQFFWGYSMYEVDGVFFSSTQGSLEERTQVVRMMFFPDLVKAGGLVSEKIVSETGTIRRLVARILKHPPPSEKESLASEYPDLVKYLKAWIAAVGIFIFGYLVFNLCERIRDLGDTGDVNLEEEIWVTSLWNLEVNKVVLTVPGGNTT